VEWTRQLGTSSNDVANDTTVDSDGNIYVTGYTYGNLGGQTNVGTLDAFLTKYDPTGAQLWTQLLGTSGSNLNFSADQGSGVTTDQLNNVYITGYTRGDLDGNTNVGSSDPNQHYDLFVTKYSAEGAKQWTKQLGSTMGDWGFDLITDTSSSLYLTGYTSGSLDGNNHFGNKDLFLLKYDLDGNKQWSKQLGTSSLDEAKGITTDSSGNVYIVGFTEGNLDGNTSAGGKDVFLVKFNSAGVKQWTQQMGTSSLDTGISIDVDSMDNVYIAGSTGGNLDGNNLTGVYDSIVVKYNSAGVKQWSRQFGTSSSDGAHAINVDSSNNLYVTGRAWGNLDSNTSEGGSDIFVVKYNSSGTKLWSKQFGTISDDSGNGITSDSSGNVYLTGQTRSGLNGNTSAGGEDIFLMKLK